MSTGDRLTWKSTFQPDSRRQDLDDMRQAFLAQRRSLGLASVRECGRIQRTALWDNLTTILERCPEVFDDPVFAIWLRFLHRAATNGRGQEVRHHYANLPAVLARAAKRLSGNERRYVPGSSITLQQDDLDVYIMAATPPTYDFLKVAQTVDETVSQGHPIGLQADLLGLALEAIGDSWPQLKAQILEVVKIIGYLPGANFRSCSAARYSGVIYLGNMDESILDIEESLVHEAGHQVLYRLAEVVPLTKPGASQEASYVLPWSGSKRDLFGFLHAFYIYTLLAKYFWRHAALVGHDAEECRKRAALVVLGLRLAKPMLKSTSSLSEQGRLLVEELCSDIEVLRAAMSNDGRIKWATK